MALKLLILPMALVALLSDLSAENSIEEASILQSAPEGSCDVEAVRVQLVEDRDQLNNELAVIRAMIKDLEKQSRELQDLQEINVLVVKDKVLEHLLEEKQKYVLLIKELQDQNLELKSLNEKNAEALRLEIKAIHERLVQEKQEYAQAIDVLKERHEKAVQQEVVAIHERLLQEKQEHAETIDALKAHYEKRLLEEKKQHLEQAVALENRLACVTEKVDWLDEGAVKKFSQGMGDFIATATLPQDQNQMESSEPVTLPVFCYRPEIKKAGGYVGLEFLWWKPFEGALDYAIKGQVRSNPQNQGQEIGAVGKLESASFAWAPGYRVYLGYRFPPDFWEIEGAYTYYHSSHNNETSFPEGFAPNTINPGAILPEEATVGTFFQYTYNPVKNATSSLRLNYNLGDLLLARRLMATDALILRILLGGTGAWIDQHFHYKYLPGDTIQNGVDVGPGSTVTGKANWKFSGGGFRMGLDTDWFIGKGFSLLSEGSLALIFGSYSQLSYNKTNNFRPSPSSFVPQVVTNLKHHDDRFVFHMRLALLPTWGMQFHSFGFLLYAGYELNFFTNLQEVYRTVSLSSASIDQRTTSSTNGDLGIQGLTAGLKFDF